MKAVIQRVLSAGVAIGGKLHSSIGQGMMILIGICDEDDDTDIGGEILVVSQFTLMASTRKGNRPSYIRAARPEVSQPLYEAFCRALGRETGHDVATGVFGADMQCSLVNDGPVTIIIDTKNRE